MIEEKRYKFLTICMCCLIIISSTIVPTFALEDIPRENIEVSEPSEPTVSEPSEPIVNPNVELEKKVDSLTDQVATLTDNINGLAMQMSQFMTMTLQDEGNQVVDVSEESIMAIANAVSTTVTVTNREGSVYTIPSAALDDWYAYTYKAIGVSQSNSNNQFIVLSNSPITSNGGGSTSAIGSYSNHVKIYEVNLFFNSCTVAYDQVNAFATKVNVVWCNHNVMSLNGSLLVRASDVASSYTVSFNTGVEGYTIPNRFSENFILPTFSYVGYSFEGWYLDSEFTEPYDEGYVFYQDTVLYAKTSKLPVISFVTGVDGLTVEPQLADNIELPSLENEGFVFGGWYLDETFETKYTANYNFTEDTTLYAKWIEPPKMGIIHETFFNGLVEVFKTEPVIYIFSLIGLIVVFGVIRKYLMSR